MIKILNSNPEFCMFNQKYSNKKSILFKVLIALFPFFNVVFTPVEEITPVVQCIFVFFLGLLYKEAPLSKLH